MDRAENGQFDAGTDFTGPWTAVTGLIEQAWVQTPTVETVATGTTMTIILQTANPDTKCGAAIMTDTWWDDVQLTDAGLPCPVPFADASGDGFVDMQDFAVLQTCLTTGDPASYDALHCACFDRNHDNVIDGHDVSAFVLCAAGPQVPVDLSKCP